MVKPQVAFFEALRRRPAIAVLERTIAALRAAGVLVLADAKRGDIGSTMAAYADGVGGTIRRWLQTRSPHRRISDSASLHPLLDTAAAHGRGVFVLAATSNPEGAAVQHAVRGDSHRRSVGRRRRRRAQPRRPGSATSVWWSVRPSPTRPMSSATGGPVLVPGVGAQGGRPDALGGFAGARPGQLLPAVSREVLRAGPDVAKLREVAERYRDAVAYLM